MLSERTRNITPSMTLGISTKVKDLARKGVKVLNLSIGEPDFFTPEKAKDGGRWAIENNKTKYDAASGLLALREEICKKLKDENSLIYTPEQIVVSSGAKHSITNALMTLINPGEEVVLPTPYWVSYPEMIKLTSGVPKVVKTSFENNFKMTATQFKNAINTNTKAVIINNPSNPTGAIYSKEELQAIAEICVEKNIYIIADEIYERICYLDSFTSIATLSKEVKALTVIINGMSKSLSMTGWRIGYTASTSEIAKGMSAIQGHLVSHPSTISQYAALHGLKACKDDIEHMKGVYQARLKTALQTLDNIEGLSYVNPDGAFYIFINISCLKNKFKDDSLSLKICDDLLNQHNVAFVPGIAFGDDNFIRMSYATDLDTIKKGLERLKNYVEK